MKKLTAIAALLAATLGAMGTAQADGRNQVTIQAIPTNAQVVVVDARQARNDHRMYNNHREQMARAAHHQRKAANTVKIIVVKQAAQHKKAKKVVYIQRPVHRPAVVDRVVYRTATTHAAPIRPHHSGNHVSLQAVYVK